MLNSPDSPATFHSDHGDTSWIDITAASPVLVYHVAEWGVHPEIEVGSDHRLIIVTLDQEVERAATRECRNWRQTDWHRFNRELFHSLDPNQCQGELLDALAVDTAVEYLTTAIQRAIGSTVPMRRVCAYSRPWWTPALTDLRRRMTATRRRWIRSGRVADREDFLLTRRGEWGVSETGAPPFFWLEAALFMCCMGLGVLHGVSFMSLCGWGPRCGADMCGPGRGQPIFCGCLIHVFGDTTAVTCTSLS